MTRILNTVHLHSVKSASIERLREVYRRASVVRSGPHLTTVNELCDQVPALRPSTLRAAVGEALQFGTFGANKILSEEDKGGPIATAFSLETDLPLCMARWYPYNLPSQVEVQLKSEYFEGKLFLNGIDKGDRVLLIEDTLSTGGTMIAMIEAVRAAGADVVGAIAIIEKEGNDGHDNVWLKTGIDVKVCLSIRVTDEGVEIIS